MQRPEHEDFTKICAVVVSNDERAEHGEEIDEICEVDDRTLAYVALQRALRAEMFMSGEGQTLNKIAAVWLDGFAAGKGWEKNYG